MNTEPLSFVTAAGEPIALAPGNTWIELADIADVAAGGVEMLPSARPPVSSPPRNAGNESTMSR